MGWRHHKESLDPFRPHAGVERQQVVALGMRSEMIYSDHGHDYDIECALRFI